MVGVGYDGVDLQAASDQNVCVTNTPGVSTEDIADLAMALLLCAVRDVLGADQFVRKGDWEKGRYPMTGSLSGKRLGIVGLGRIGKAVAVRAQAFGMNVAYTGRAIKQDQPYLWFDNARSLASHVDYLVVCASGGPETSGMINARVIEALGPTGVLVNVARGSLVDEPALISALSERRILAAGLDVFSNEPDVAPALRTLPNVVLTPPPHMAGSTESTAQAMLQMALKNVRDYFNGKAVLSRVN